MILDSSNQAIAISESPGVDKRPHPKCADLRACFAETAVLVGEAQAGCGAAQTALVRGYRHRVTEAEKERIRMVIAGHRYHAISARLGLTRSNVKIRLYRIRLILRPLMRRALGENNRVQRTVPLWTGRTVRVACNFAAPPLAGAVAVGRSTAPTPDSSRRLHDRRRN